MQRQQLEIYTQDHSHHGVNSEEVLSMFIKYQSLCQDPLNVFRYMEERAICIFMPSFWLAKAELLAEMGDYNGCFQCVDLASSRIDEDQVQYIKIIEERQKSLYKKLIDDMKQFPLKAKRTVAEFNLNLDCGLGKSSKSKIAETIKIYQEKYKTLRGQKEKTALGKWQKLPKSWLFEKYLKEDEVQKIIEQKIHENSIRLSKDVKYHSMHTPIRQRDPQRLTKTMDSVQIMKKKRSTRQKSRKNKNVQNHQSDTQNNLDSSRQERMMNSLPVGQKFNLVKRRVTFRHENAKIQKLRKADVHTPSFGKIIPQSSNNSDDMKMEEELFSEQNALSEAYSKK